MKETRTAVLLTRLAKKIRKETGDQRYRARIEDERASLKTLIYISCTRPLRAYQYDTLGESFHVSPHRSDVYGANRVKFQRGFLGYRT